MVRRPFTPKQFSSTVGVQEAMMDGEESSINFKRKILQRIKDLTNHGKHIEANNFIKSISEDQMARIDLHNFFKFYDERNPNHVKAVQWLEDNLPVKYP
jgi:hypothetical protein